MLGIDKNCFLKISTDIPKLFPKMRSKSNAARGNERECLLTRLPHLKCIRLGSVRLSPPVLNTLG